MVKAMNFLRITGETPLCVCFEVCMATQEYQNSLRGKWSENEFQNIVDSECGNHSVEY